MSNENLNLAEILKDCKKGTKLYSPLFGEVEFNYIHESFSGGCVIECETECGVWFFNQDGTITITTMTQSTLSEHPKKHQSFIDIGRIKYADVNWYYFCNFFKYSNSNG